MTVMIPPSPEQLGGPYVTTTEGFEVRGVRGNAMVIEFDGRPGDVEWFQPCEFLYCQRQHDPETFKVIRKATMEDLRILRVPCWIQGDEVPECCGLEMRFVAQIDDDRLCAEAPAGAKIWWHDAASFYVFTCSQCLKCQAIGQQL